MSETINFRDFECISSKANKSVRHVSKLNKEAKYRRHCEQFVAEGARLCEEAALYGNGISSLYLTEKASQVYQKQLKIIMEKAERRFVITEEVSAFMSDTKSPQGVFCVCNTLDIKRSCGKISSEHVSKFGFVVLENIQDPSNLGAIIRTAEALGISSVFLSDDCCNIYNPKVLRSSMGAVFRLSINIAENLPDFILRLKDSGIESYACVAQNDALPITSLSDVFAPIACVIGNEGAGLTQNTMDSCTHKITIPMHGHGESLNAAMAAGIVLWEMVRGK